MNLNYRLIHKPLHKLGENGLKCNILYTQNNTEFAPNKNIILLGHEHKYSTIKPKKSI